MSFSYAKLTGVVPVTATGSVPQSVYLNQNGTRTYVSELEFHNWDSATRQITVNIVPGGFSPSAANQIMKMSITSTDTVWIEPAYPYILDGTDSIQILANGTGINAQLRGGTE